MRKSDIPGADHETREHFHVILMQTLSLFSKKYIRRIYRYKAVNKFRSLAAHDLYLTSVENKATSCALST